MPNWCHFQMIAGGRREDVELLCEILDNDYSTVHMSRIDNVNVYRMDKYGMYRRAFIDGECAWSVYCCMMDGDYSYFGDYVKQITNPPHPRVAKNIKYTITGVLTNIIKLSEQLNLDIAILGTEPGMAFCELYKIKNGKVEVNETGQYNELYIDECETWQDVIDEYGEDITNHFTEAEFHEAKGGYQANIIKSTYTEEDLMRIAPPEKPEIKEEDKKLLYKVVDPNK